MKPPLQPIYKDEDGIVRFQQNEIVRFLLDLGGFDLNQLANMPFSDEDRAQFAQLIGYSLNDFDELKYVDRKSFDEAQAIADTLT